MHYHSSRVLFKKYYQLCEHKSSQRPIKSQIREHTGRGVIVAFLFEIQYIVVGGILLRQVKKTCKG